jgi:O-methyltransferase involved in polyketide biosynthesis
MSCLCAKWPEIAETLFIPLYFRALETQRINGLFRDDPAVELVEKIDYDFSRFKGYDLLQTAVAMRVREMDRCVQEFIEAHPRATVVNLGCGLDTRFQRLDNGLLQWFELDLAPVISLRRCFFKEGPRYRYISGSAFDGNWMEAISPSMEKGLLFLAEGLFPYFPVDRVSGLMLNLGQRFPGAMLMFDAVSPLQAELSHFHPALTLITEARFKWGLRNARHFEDPGNGIRLVRQVYYFDGAKRLGRHALLLFFPHIRYGFSIVVYRLGRSAYRL